MKAIDAHIHLIERFAGFGAKGEARPIGHGAVRWGTGEEQQIVPKGMGDYGFSAETVIELMDNNEIEKAVVLQGSGYGFQNEYTAEAVKKYPTRLKGAATLDPYCSKVKEIFAHLVNDLKFQILKFEMSEVGGLQGIHPSISIDGKEMEYIWEEASSRHMTVVLDLGALGANERHIKAVKKVLDKYIDVKIVIAHLLTPAIGQKKLLMDMLAALKNDRLWFDIAALPWVTAPDLFPYGTAAQYVAAAKEIVGKDRLLWGSDIPMVLTKEKYSNLKDYLVLSGLFTTAELEMLMYDNAKEVYDL